MKGRIKLKTAAPKSREEMEALVGEIASLKIQERSIKASMDITIKNLKDGYQANLSEITDKLGALLPRAMAWAEANPDAFGKLRSIDMVHGVVGWRTNTPSLKTLSGWTWDRVLERLKGLPSMFGYVRAKEEVNKQALLNDRDEIGADELRAIGLRVIQEDEFFVDPKLSETEKRETVEAS